MAVEHSLGSGEEPDLRLEVGARLPTRYGTFVAWAFAGDPPGGHDAVFTLGDPRGRRPPLVRLHSECLTGDVLGSLRCDCGTQLDRAIQCIAEEGRGALVYLRQEGRGIGLANKLRAYALQDAGLDTVEANERLGFAADLRDYASAARLLRALEIDGVRLLTNNPRKIAGLRAEGISVVERVPLVVGSNAHNRAYLRAKREKLGHFPA